MNDTVKCLAVDLDTAERDLSAVRARLEEAVRLLPRSITLLSRWRSTTSGQPELRAECEEFYGHVRAFLAQHATPAPVREAPPTFTKLQRDLTAAYVVDRAEQYDEDSGSRAALFDVAKQINDGEAEAAYSHGELDVVMTRWGYPLPGEAP